MQLRLLGPLALEGTEGPVPLGGKKQRSLLAMLAVHENRAVSEDRLIDAVWGEDAPRTALRTLNSYISRLRQALHGTELSIDSTPGGYVLRVAAEAVDVTQVADLLARARADADPEARIAALAEAAALWRGEPLGEFASEPWAMAEAARLAELHQALTEERIDAMLAAGRHAAVIPEIEALTASFPLRERFWALRMLALYRAGRQSDALRAFQELRTILAEEVGVQPSPDLRDLEAAILAQSSTLDLAPAAPSSPAVSFAILGPLRVTRNGVAVSVRGDGLRILLAILLLADGSAVAVDRLIGALWVDDQPDNAIALLRAQISRLRKALGDDALIQTESSGYSLPIDAEQLDAARFAVLSKRGRDELDHGNAAAAVDTLSDALALWSGPALADLPGRPFVVAEAARLDEARLVAVEDRIDAQLAVGRHRSIIGELEYLTQLHPLRQRLWGQLMLALSRSGRQAEALRSFQRVRAYLAAEVGLEPGADLRRLEQEIVGQDPAPVSSTPRIRLMLVDDHPMWREAMRATLERNNIASVVAEAGDGEAAIVEAKKARPDVILMDLHLPHLSGSDATKRLRDAVPDAKVLMLSASGEEADVLRAVRAGARGYLLKSSSGAEVADAVRRAAAGEVVFTSTLAGAVLDEVRDGPKTSRTGLTDRQREVLRLLSEDHTYDDIAERLSVSEADVRMDVTRAVTGPPSGRAVRTVGFVDVVESTKTMADIGDAGWQALLGRFNAIVRSLVATHGGHDVMPTGDGMLVCFDQPGPAVRAALQMAAGVRVLGVEIRSGLHVGECDVSPDEGLSGLAVNIASRITDHGGASEVLVSRTVYDLVIGSGFDFADVGTKALRGVPGKWQLFSVSDRAR